MFLVFPTGAFISIATHEGFSSSWVRLFDPKGYVEAKVKKPLLLCSLEVSERTSGGMEFAVFHEPRKK